jgi:hypothetical protein
MELVVAAMAIEGRKREGKHPIKIEVDVHPRNAVRGGGGAGFGTVTRLRPDRIRGVAIYVPGVLGNRANIAKELAEDNWLVVTVWPPLVDRVLEVFRTSPDIDPFERGVRVAAEVDRSIVEAATLARMQVEVVRGLYPSLHERPRLMVCESMGAIAGVGMAATDSVACDACLLVAGGGGFLDVACESSARRLLFGDLPLDDPRFREGFDSVVAFDPIRAGPRLRGAPLVLITADEDTIVPAALQDSLWRALGEPPRYRWSGGHLELFLRADVSVMPVVREIVRQMPTQAQQPSEQDAGVPAGVAPKSSGP